MFTTGFAHAEVANFEPFSEPETAGFINGVIANADADESLGAKVKQELQANGNGKLDHIEVTVEEEGTIALQGTVKDESEKEEAQAIASKIEGVNEVHNRLIVQN